MPHEDKLIAELRSPMLQEALAYWRSKCGDRAMPARADIDPLDIPRLLPNIILFDVLPPDRRLKVRLVGTFVVDMFGGDYTGQYLDEIDFGEVRDKVLRDYSNALALARPLISDHTFRKLGGVLFDIERLIVPLSEDGKRVTMLVAFLDFRERDDQPAWS